MKMKINNSCCCFFLLPVEISADIFSRLPFHSVLQCKLVCKTWRDLLIVGGFLLRLQPYNGEPSRFHYGEYYDDDDKIPCFNLIKNAIFNHQYPFENADKWYVFGSCNGLICLRQRWLGICRSKSCEPGTHHYDDMYVCNPYTGEYAKLPKTNHPKLVHPNEVDLTYYRFMSCNDDPAYGFGYHPITKEYKVIRIYYNHVDCWQRNILKSSSTSVHVEVYTLGSDTAAWRSIGGLENEDKLLYRNIIITRGNNSGNNIWGILLNGALYWSTENKRIVSFDLADEKFEDIPLPQELISNYFNPKTTTVLGVLDGCLCVSTHIGVTTHIWVMNMKEEYSWSKKFDISWIYDYDYSHNCPLEHLRSGKILLHHDFNEIFSYDPETEQIVEIKRRMQIHPFDIIPYTKSSVSLKALGEKEAIQVKARIRREQEEEDQKELVRRPLMGMEEEEEEQMPKNVEIKNVEDLEQFDIIPYMRN